MREFTCIVCGKKAIDKSAKKCAKFCGEKCRNRYRYMAKKEDIRNPSPCQYNEGVFCTKQKCGSCGRNPAVEKRRKERLL